MPYGDAQMSRHSDRLRIDYTSGVPVALRRQIVEMAVAMLEDSGYYVVETYSNTASAWHLDVTVHDPNEPHPVTDNQVNDYLKSVAQEKGISLVELLQQATLELEKDNI